MVDSVFWIWMQEALGVGSIKADKVIQEIGSPEILRNMSQKELAQTGFFAPKEIDKILHTGMERARENQLRAKKCGCHVITPDHPHYPESLRNIPCMPCVLYVVGDLSKLNQELVLTMVGTRSSNEEGERTAEKLAFDLASAGCTIASGLAVGIDYASHEGALRANGRSIGLLACGMDVDYPTASNTLKRRILDKGGALLTEFSFGEQAYRYHFNIRNRILSGIASGVVVVQASQHSGAMNTARHALEQNRDVFAVPGGIFDDTMTGCNRLIRDGGKMVVNVYSILEEYIHKFPDTIDPKSIVPKIRYAASHASGEKPVNIPRKVTRTVDGESRELLMVAQETALPLKRLDQKQLEEKGISPAAIRIYTLLERQPLGCDWLAEQTGMSSMEIMVGLTELELSELTQAHPGKRYTLCEDCPEAAGEQ